MKRVILLVPIVALLAACGSSSTPRRQALADTPRKPTCPAAWLPGWQKLANRAHAPVYCPSWMPDPLNARIGGVYTDINAVDRDHSYLISFVWFESGAEVHVNFRGYPGRTRIPTCSDLDTNKPVPCFADQKGIVREGEISARVFTANQGVDMWHVLYAWRHEGSLYTISEHVAFPYTYAETVQNLKRMLRGLVLVRPTS
jgi:hypothetical protein